MIDAYYRPPPQVVTLPATLPRPSDELVDYLGRTAQLPPQQVTMAVEAMLQFLATRLPSTLFGELLVSACEASAASPRSID